MTEPTPRRTVVCPDCSALIPHAAPAMQNHRSFHNDLKAKHDGIRSRLNGQDEKITRATREATEARHAADTIDIPVPPAPLEISDDPDDWEGLPDYERDQQPDFGVDATGDLQFDDPDPAVANAYRSAYEPPDYDVTPSPGRSA